MKHWQTFTGFGLLCAGMLGGCSPERLVHVGEPPKEPTCASDDACGDDALCIFGECTDIGKFVCRDGESPLVRVSSLEASLGNVPIGESATTTVTLESVGSCLLEVAGVGLDDDSHPGFSCSPCSFAAYPQMLVPGRSLDIDVTYTGLGLGEANGTLLIKTDDITAAPPGDFIRVNLHAAYTGLPVLILDPGEVNYGFVSFDGSATPRTETVRIMNLGTGNAALKIDFIYVSPPGAGFSIPAELATISPANPTLLAPYNAADPNTYLDVPVTFQPTTNANYEARLMVHAGEVEGSAQAEASARLAGSSLGPPSITVAPLDLEFKTASGDALPLGTVGFRQVSISNNGQSELTLDLGLDDPSGDYSFSPTHIAPLPPGAGAVVSVFYNPSAPSDLANPANPANPVSAFLRVVSNDPTAVLTTVSLKGWAKSSVSDDVLRVDLDFTNSGGGWASNDFRNVHLELESPMGFMCKKPEHIYMPNGQGGYNVVAGQDYCAQWSDSGQEGQVAWLPLGEMEERILLYGLGPDLASGGIFKVKAYYAEDCSNVPTSLVADIAGIGVSALLGILGAQIGVPIHVPADQISNLISENCWSRSSALVTVSIFVNGEEVAAPSVRLYNKGDTLEVARIQRQGGTFVVLP